MPPARDSSETIRFAPVPLVGHDSLRARLGASADNGTLPSSLLFHGRAGVGKQRLALWLGARLLCESATDRPCGTCRSCRWVAMLSHPDLAWVFPRPRLKDSDASPSDVWDDLASATTERVSEAMLYEPAAGTDAIYVATVRALLRRIAMTPAVATRKVIIVGDAERMVPQEGAEAAANAFLKVLEEPPADTTIILTSSEPGALLPTIRSRVVAVRVPPLSDRDMVTFVRHDAVNTRIGGDAARESVRLRAAAGAPGALLAASADGAADAARAMLDATRDRATMYKMALRQGGAGARGAFVERLDALTALLHGRAKAAVAHGALDAARAHSEHVQAVEKAKALAEANVNPQLVTAALLRELEDR